MASQRRDERLLRLGCQLCNRYAAKMIGPLRKRMKRLLSAGNFVAVLLPIANQDGLQGHSARVHIFQRLMLSYAFCEPDFGDLKIFCAER